MVGPIILGYWFILNTIIHVSSSFRLEFDDYDSVQATKYPCFGLGSRCDMTPECCRPATCVLPSWSPSPICLVPGYKQLLGDLQANSPARIRDILHIKQLYNISYFDHLLIDLSTSPPSREVDIDPSTYITSKDSYEHYGMENKSNITERVEQNNSSTSVVLESMKTMSPGSSDYLSKPIELNSTLKELSDYLKKQVKFLIITSSIGSNNGTGNIITNLNNSDQFKEVVKLLEEKLELLNQNQSMTEKHVLINDSSSSKSIQSTTPKESKWNLVKAYFFKNKKSEMGSSSVLEIESPPMIATNEHYETPSYDDNATFQDPLIDNIDSDERIKEAFRKLYSPKIINDLLINNYDNIENGTGTSNEDIVEVYNIDIPSNMEQQNEKGVSVDKVDTEQVFSTITKTLGSIDANEHSLEILQNSGDHETLIPNKTEIEITSETTQRSSEKTHFWQKVYLWPVNENISKRLTKELKDFFVWKKRPKTLDTSKPTLVLDEKFILNSKNQSEHISDQASVCNDQTTSDYSIGYSSSVESSLEDLYNNSYVFVVRKDNSSAPIKEGIWKNIFSRIMHSSKNNKNTNISNKLSISNTKEINSTVVEEVIRLPEYLMPEALKEREVNETDDWLFEDSKEIEEKTFIEQRSSNGTFLFFFKWKS